MKAIILGLGVLCAGTAHGFAVLPGRLPAPSCALRGACSLRAQIDSAPRFSRVNGLRAGERGWGRPAQRSERLSQQSRSEDWNSPAVKPFSGPGLSGWKTNPAVKSVESGRTVSLPGYYKDEEKVGVFSSVPSRGFRRVRSGRPLQV